MKIDKSWYIKPRGIFEGVNAGGLVVRSKNNKFYIALIGGKKFDSFILPKGRVERGESMKATAAREIFEETGLNDIKLVCKLGVKERFVYNKKEWRKMYYFLFVTNQMRGRQNLQEGEEGYIMKWFDLESLPNFFWPEQKALIEENLGKIKKLVKEAL